jgi:hypothetical protein
MKTLVVLALTIGALSITSIATATTSPIAGNFRVTLKGSISVLNGVWLLNVAANGGYKIVKEPTTSQVLISGISTVSGHSLTFTDMGGPLACKGSQASGTYSFTLSGKKLTLKIVKDKCAGRAYVLAASHLTKSG